MSEGQRCEKYVMKEECEDKEVREVEEGAQDMIYIKLLFSLAPSPHAPQRKTLLIYY